MMWAAEKGHVKAAKALMTKGANPKAKDKNGTTALDIALKAGNAKIVELLRACGAKKQISWTRSAKAGHIYQPTKFL